MLPKSTNGESVVVFYYPKDQVQMGDVTHHVTKSGSDHTSESVNEYSSVAKTVVHMPGTAVLIYLHVLIFTCIYTCIFTCTCTYIYMYVYLHVHIFTCTYIYMYVYLHLHVFTCTYIYMYLYLHVFTHVYLHVHVFTCTYIYMYLHMYIYMYMYLHVHVVIYDLKRTLSHKIILIKHFSSIAHLSAIFVCE